MACKFFGGLTNVRKRVVLVVAVFYLRHPKDLLIESAGDSLAALKQLALARNGCGLQV